MYYLLFTLFLLLKYQWGRCAGWVIESEESSLVSWQCQVTGVSWGSYQALLWLGTHTRWKDKTTSKWKSIINVPKSHTHWSFPKCSSNSGIGQLKNFSKAELNRKKCTIILCVNPKGVCENCYNNHISLQWAHPLSLFLG